MGEQDRWKIIRISIALMQCLTESQSSARGRLSAQSLAVISTSDVKTPALPTDYLQIICGITSNTHPVVDPSNYTDAAQQNTQIAHARRQKHENNRTSRVMKTRRQNSCQYLCRIQ